MMLIIIRLYIILIRCKSLLIFLVIWIVMRALELLNEVTKLFNNSPYDQIYSILNITSATTGCSKVRFYIREGKEYICYAALPKEDEEKLLGLHIPELTYIKTINKVKRPVIIDSNFDDNDKVKDLLNQKWFALIPVRIGDGDGFISIDNPEGDLPEGLEERLKVLNKLVNECFYNAEAKKVLHQISITDRLTGLYNRVYLDEMFPEYLNDLSNKNESFYLALLDINGLKKINDTYGHNAGDQLLTGFSTALKHTLHSIDRDSIAVRFGGDEFVIIGKGTKEDAENLIVSLKTKLSKRNTYINLDNNNLISLPLNFSIGYSLSVSVRGLESKRILNDERLRRDYMIKMLVQADKDMYEDKRKDQNVLKTSHR